MIKFIYVLDLFKLPNLRRPMDATCVLLLITFPNTKDELEKDNNGTEVDGEHKFSLLFMAQGNESKPEDLCQ